MRVSKEGRPKFKAAIEAALEEYNDYWPKAFRDVVLEVDRAFETEPLIDEYGLERVGIAIGIRAVQLCVTRREAGRAGK